MLLRNMVGRETEEWLENIAENSQELINFLQGEEREDLTAPLETDPDELKSKLAFRVYNHIHNFFEGYYRDGDFGYNDRSTALYKVDYPNEADYNGDRYPCSIGNVGTTIMSKQQQVSIVSLLRLKENGLNIG